MFLSKRKTIKLIVVKDAVIYAAKIFMLPCSAGYKTANDIKGAQQ